MDVHASTQMTIHNLQGVLALEKLGFKRVVLSRELSLADIRYICANSNIEIETFVHGALCISYSGQCLFSSTIGARSGNRGKCAQPCRLPYKLMNENEQILDQGYLLSPRDLCSLQYIPDLINAGVTCFKIEGRMKTSEYVATVTSIYRKYIDLALSGNDYVVDEKDIKKLMQVFNRGGFSSGNFEDDENLNYVYKEKPNNMGLYIGNVSSFGKEKGLITLNTKESLSIGDQISLEKEEHKYTITELMKNKVNIPTANPNETVTIGRMKGNISLGDRVYKLSSKSFSKTVKEFYEKENIKIPLNCKITIKKDIPISIEVNSLDDGNYSDISFNKVLDVTPTQAINAPITKERIIEQLSKTTDTEFEFKNIEVELDDNVYIPKISHINELRRECLKELENIAIHRFERVISSQKNLSKQKLLADKDIFSGISLLLNEFNPSLDYSKLHKVERIYLPLKAFTKKETRTEEDHFSEKIFDDLLAACLKLQRNVTFSHTSEDQRNDFIRDILETSGYSSGYEVRDQTRQGKSATGKNSGEVDLLVYRKGRPISVIEALNLTSLDSAYLSKHIDKIFTYDTAGNRINYILSYVTITDFSGFWDKYINFVTNYKYPFPLKNIDTQVQDNYNYSDLRYLITSHNQNGYHTMLYHICVKMLQ